MQGLVELQEALELTGRMGGREVGSPAALNAPEAYWASWADAFPMVLSRTPILDARLPHGMGTEEATSNGSIAETRSARGLLTAEAFDGYSTWAIRNQSRRKKTAST